MNKSFLILMLSILFLGTGSAYAQAPVFAPPGVEDQLTTTVTPTVPQPNSDVTIFIQSFSTNLNKAYITWTVNGVIADQGVGKTTLVFRTGNAGTETRVNADIRGEDGRSISKTFSFAPAEVTLVAEALTYTPPFYKGKALFIPQSTLRVVAFPEFVTSNGARISPTNLNYTWRKDGKVLQSESGFGKQVLSIEGSIIPRAMDIAVEVSAVGSNLKANHVISVKPEEPEIIFYEDSLILGPLWNRGVKDNLYLTTREISLRAEPYFLSAWTAEDPNLAYSFRVGGNIVNQTPNENSLGLRNESDEEGNTRISLTVDNKGKILQSVQTSLLIDFTRPR